MKTKHFIIASGMFKHYGKTRGLIAILMLFYNVATSKEVYSNKIPDRIATIALKNTTINPGDSNANDSIGLVISNPIYSGTNAIADRLNFTVQENESIADSMVNSYFDGVEDADSTYKIKKSTRLGTLIATVLFSPLLTFMPVVISSAISPSAKRLHPEPSMSNNAAYMKGYKYQAQYIKKRILWGSFIGGGTPWCIVMGFFVI